MRAILRAISKGMEMDDSRYTTRRKTCAFCNIEQDWRFLKLAKDNRWIYVNEEGKRWNGKRCPKCFLAQNRGVRYKKSGKNDSRS